MVIKRIVNENVSSRARGNWIDLYLLVVYIESAGTCCLTTDIWSACIRVAVTMRGVAEVGEEALVCAAFK